MQVEVVPLVPLRHYMQDSWQGAAVQVKLRVSAMNSSLHISWQRLVVRLK